MQKGLSTGKPIFCVGKIVFGHFFEFFSAFASREHTRTAKTAKYEPPRGSSVSAHSSPKPDCESRAAALANHAPRAKPEFLSGFSHAAPPLAFTARR